MTISFKFHSPFSLDFSHYPPQILPLDSQELSKHSLEHWVAVEAWIGNHCAALALAEVYHHNSVAKWVSLIVDPVFRHQGIGQQLFACMQTYLLQKEKRAVITFNYVVESPWTPYFEKILAKQKWSPAQTSLMRYFLEESTFNPPWFQQAHPLPPSVELFSWNTLTSQDRLKIDYLVSQGRVLPHLSPFYNDEEVHIETSVGLRKQGQLIGWCITHLINAETLCYGSVFFDKSIQSRSYGAYLVLESIRRQKTLKIPLGLFEYDPHELDLSWIHFIQKRLAPFFSQKQTIKTAIFINK